MGLTFASYVLQPFFEADCEIPTAAKQLLAAATICFLTYLNSCYMKVTTKMQNVIMFTKIGALVLIILIGLVWMFMGMLQFWLKEKLKQFELSLCFFYFEFRSCWKLQRCFCKHRDGSWKIVGGFLFGYILVCRLELSQLHDWGITRSLQKLTSCHLHLTAFGDNNLCLGQYVLFSGVECIGNDSVRCHRSGKMKLLISS